jgi:hypothetical protein
MKVNAKDVPHDAPPPVSSAHIDSPAAIKTRTVVVRAIARSRAKIFTAH